MSSQVRWVLEKNRQVRGQHGPGEPIGANKLILTSGSRSDLAISLRGNNCTENSRTSSLTRIDKTLEYF